MGIRSFIAKGIYYPVMRILTNENFQSQAYWENRYVKGGNSGGGSYGRLAQFKAETINNFVTKNNIDSMIEFGCGDGNQLSFYEIQKYIGVDVSQNAVERCVEKFASDNSKIFVHSADMSNIQPQNLSISIDVIFHLVEDEVFNKYMEQLFFYASNYVIIYSSNVEVEESAVHVRHRKFSDWIAENETEWKLIQTVKNPYPAEIGEETKNTSFADFYVYQKMSNESPLHTELPRGS